jgi:electron transfer flavoprotein alpha/beta subunit
MRRQNIACAEVVCAVLDVRVQVQLLQQERSFEATAANPDQEAAIEAAIRAETDFLMQVKACCVVRADEVLL